MYVVHGVSCLFRVIIFITWFQWFQAADLVDGKENAYTDLAQGQMDYILGGNPKGQR